jgi:hypothetical protein
MWSSDESAVGQIRSWIKRAAVAFPQFTSPSAAVCTNSALQDRISAIAVPGRNSTAAFLHMIDKQNLARFANGLGPGYAGGYLSPKITY